MANRSSTEKWALRLKFLGQQQLVVHDHVHEQSESTEHAGHSLNDRPQCGEECVAAFGDSRVREEPLLSSFVDLPQDRVFSSLRITVLQACRLRVRREIEPDVGARRGNGEHGQ